jgi:hypothetical protein
MTADLNGPARPTSKTMIGNGSMTNDSDILPSDPHRIIGLANKPIRRNADDSNAYFDRHFGWKMLGRLDLALADLGRSLALENHP